MRSEDIARYVAGLEAEVERLRVELVTERQSVERFSAAHERTAERLRAALPALPDVGPVTRISAGYVECDGLSIPTYLSAEEREDDARTHLRKAAVALAVAAFLDAEPATEPLTDTSREIDERFVVGRRPTYMGHYITPEYVSPGEVVAAHRVKVEDGIQYAFTYREKDGSSLSIDMSCLTPVDEIADHGHTPESFGVGVDTSRVTFGARHEGTGMVLLQHPETPFSSWGLDKFINAELHRRRADDPGLPSWLRGAHADLAEVREALNTAEADGVDVPRRMRVDASMYADDPALPAITRTRMFLAREVQALVDQGLRGDDLNAAVPFEVRDHRAPVAAAETSSSEAPPCPVCGCWLSAAPGGGECTQCAYRFQFKYAQAQELADAVVLTDSPGDQAQRIDELTGALGLAMRTLSDEITRMQAASIAERLQPGTGMQWIDDSLTEAMTYPCQDGAWGPVWDGQQSALAWFEAVQTHDAGKEVSRG